MNSNKKQIETDEDMHMAMAAVKSSIQLIGVFDWQHMVERIAFFEGAGAVINPGLFLAMQRDPEWEQKKQLFTAAAQFVAKIEDIQKQLSSSHEK